jgi:hypothetical protein
MMIMMMMIGPRIKNVGRKKPPESQPASFERPLREPGGRCCFGAGCPSRLLFASREKDSYRRGCSDHPAEECWFWLQGRKKEVTAPVVM